METCSRLPLQATLALLGAPRKMEGSVSTLLAPGLRGLLLASRNNAFLAQLPVWGALINGAATLGRGRCFFTAAGSPDGWRSRFPGWGGLDQGSLSPLQASSITSVPSAAVWEAPFVCVSSCNPPRHPNGEGTVIVVHFLAGGQESPHPRPGTCMRWQIQERCRLHVGLIHQL